MMKILLLDYLKICSGIINTYEKILNSKAIQLGEIFLFKSHFTM